MLKLLFAAMAICLAVRLPASAQSVETGRFTAGSGDLDVGWEDVDAHRTSDVAITANNTNGAFFVQPKDNTHSQTTQQNSYQNNYRGQPLSTVTSMPYPQIPYFAPGNFAGRQSGGSMLPVTNLDSFVYQSGMSDLIYGNEPTIGPARATWAPLGDGMYSQINDANHPNGQPGLTTGHGNWGAPSSWY